MRYKFDSKVNKIFEIEAVDLATGSLRNLLATRMFAIYAVTIIAAILFAFIGDSPEVFIAVIGSVTTVVGGVIGYYFYNQKRG